MTAAPAAPELPARPGPTGAPLQRSAQPGGHQARVSGGSWSAARRAASQSFGTSFLFLHLTRGGRGAGGRQGAPQGPGDGCHFHPSGGGSRAPRLGPPASRARRPGRLISGAREVAQGHGCSRDGRRVPRSRTRATRQRVPFAPFPAPLCARRPAGAAEVTARVSHRPPPARPPAGRPGRTATGPPAGARRGAGAGRPGPAGVTGPPAPEPLARLASLGPGPAPSAEHSPPRAAARGAGKRAGPRLRQLLSKMDAMCPAAPASCGGLLLLLSAGLPAARPARADG